MRKLLWGPLVGAFIICAASVGVANHNRTHKSHHRTADQPVARLCQVPDSIYPEWMGAMEPQLFEYCAYIPSRYNI